MSASLKLLRLTCLFFLAYQAVAANADDRADYQKRVAIRLVTLFQALDLDRDGRVTREEAAGDLNFRPVFPDMDINGDSAVTMDELRRYIDLKLGVDVQTQASAQ